MVDHVTCKLFEGLVQRFGGVEAVAALLEARYGAASKGTVSKMCAGHLAVTIDAAVAVEDALISYPITKRQASRINGAEQVEANQTSLPDLAALAGLETAEALAVILRGFGPNSADPSRLTKVERASALKELTEARDVFDRMIDLVEGGV